MFKFKTFKTSTHIHIVTYDIDCHFVHYSKSESLVGNIYFIFSKEDPSRFNVPVICKINNEYLWTLCKGKIIEYDEKSIEVNLSEYIDCSNLYFAKYNRGKLYSIYRVYKLIDDYIYSIRVDFPYGDIESLTIKSESYFFLSFFKLNIVECSSELKNVFERRIKEICNLCLQK